jgi:hypothetical protein
MYQRSVEGRAVRKTIGSLAAVAAAGVLTFAVLPVASASAGWNGQQVSVCAGWDSEQAEHAEIQGENQHNRQSTEVIPIVPGTCKLGENVTRNWWWKGPVQISFAGQDGQFTESHICDVPQKQDSDIFLC